MQDQELSASLSGTLTLGRDLTIHRLGFGGMRITGDGCGVRRRTQRKRFASCAALWNSV